LTIASRGEVVARLVDEPDREVGLACELFATSARASSGDEIR
jgi:hypothetical protein